MDIVLEGHTVCIHYEKKGKGTKTLLTFHGFGFASSQMYGFGKTMEGYTIYHIDLFYHGRSYWDNTLGPLTKKNWHHLISEFTERENIKYFDLAAFSMGAKFALSLVETMGERVGTIWLMAPDGLYKNFWYSLATGCPLIRRYFQSMIVKPWRFFSLVKLLAGFKIISDKLVKFSIGQMDTQRKRRQVYYCWTMFRRLNFNQRKLAVKINRHGIKVFIYLGKDDKVIGVSEIKRFARHLKNCKIYILNSGHRHLLQVATRAISEKIFDLLFLSMMFIQLTIL